MKKIIALLLGVLTMLILGSCGGEGKPQPTATPSPSVTPEPQYDYINLLKDPKFQKGFGVRGLGKAIYNDPIELFGTDMYGRNALFQYGKSDLPTPDWDIAQWASRYPFHDINNTMDPFDYRFTQLGESEYLYENRSKTVQVNTESGDFRLALKASECYKYDRTEGQEWPHLLLEQTISTGQSAPSYCKITNMEGLRMRVDMKLNSFEDHMIGPANENLHSCILMLYVTIANRIEQTGYYNDSMYLGLTLFDNRTPFPNGMSFSDLGSKASATGKWVYNIPGTHYLSMDNCFYDAQGNMVFDSWVNVDIDILKYVNLALKDAQRGGAMKNATLDTLYVNTMYIGFELPGTYDVDMSFKNFAIESIIQE